MKRRILIFLKNKSGMTILLFLLALPIAGCISVQPKMADTPISVAVKNGNTDDVKSELMRGVDVNSRCDYGEPILSKAISLGYRDIAMLLIEKGANVNAATEGGYTPLTEAAAYGEIEIVKVLISKGANVKAETKPLLWTGIVHTPLTIAALGVHGLPDDVKIQVINILAANGADVDKAIATLDKIAQMNKNVETSGNQEAFKSATNGANLLRKIKSR